MRIKLALASLASLALVIFPATAFAGYAPSNRPTFQCITPTNCPGANYVVFNSFTNAVNYGDERAFFDAKDAAITTSGGYQDSVPVHDGETVEMRVYVHNNANPNAIGVAAATAHNTTILVLLPTGAARTTQEAAAEISASNANPANVSDTVDLTASTPFTVSLDSSSPVMVTYRPNGQGNYVTNTLPNVVFNGNSWSANVGDWKGCFNYAALITFNAVVHMPTTPTPPVTPVTPVSKTTVLPNTGAGDVLGIFAGASAVGTAGHYFVARRRRS